MGSTPGSTKLGLVGGATKSDVSSWVLVVVATTEVSTTPGCADAELGSETSVASKTAESTLIPGLSVATTVVYDLRFSGCTGWFGCFLGSYCNWLYAKT